jgi:hypothetical protein
MKMIPSSRANQMELDRITKESSNKEALNGALAEFRLLARRADPSRHKLIVGPDDINRGVDALWALLKELPESSEQITSLDTECNWQDGGGPVALMQLSYETEGEVRALLFKMQGLKKLPRSLLAFFKQETVTHVGVNVQQDMAKIGRSVKVLGQTMENCKCIDLADMAKE